MFFGREKEIKELEHYYQQFIDGHNLSSFLIGVEGRRCVGKTVFIQHFIQTKIKEDSHYNLFFFYFIGRICSSKENINHCLNDLMNFIQQNEFSDEQKQVMFSIIDNSLLKKYKNWDNFFALFSEITLYIEQQFEDAKFFVFEDEFSWFSKKSEFLSSFSGFWNKTLTGRNNFMIFIASSNSFWIKQRVFQNKVELYNRLTTIISLKPFSLDEIKQYCQRINSNISDRDVIVYYMMFGGVIHYYKNLNLERDLEFNLKLLVNKTAYFKNEYNILYEGLFNGENKKELFLNCLALICAKKQVTFETLLSHFTKQDKEKNSKTLSNNIREVLTLLQENQLVVAENTGFKSQLIYMLNDQFIYFIYYWKDKMKSLPLDQDFSTWKGAAFEITIFNNLYLIENKLNIIFDGKKFLNHQFEHQGKRKQIDLLIQQKQDYILEMKSYFDKNYFDTDDLMDLFAKARLFKDKNNSHFVYVVLCSISPLILSKKYVILQKDNPNIKIINVSLE